MDLSYRRVDTRLGTYLQRPREMRYRADFGVYMEVELSDDFVRFVLFFFSGYS